MWAGMTFSHSCLSVCTSGRWSGIGPMAMRQAINSGVAGSTPCSNSLSDLYQIPFLIGLKYYFRPFSGACYSTEHESNAVQLG